MEETKKIIIPNSFVNIFINKEGINEIVRTENWKDVDFSQFENVINDLLSLTFDMVNNIDDGYMYDFEEGQYFKPMNFDFESRPCSRCCLNSFDYEFNEEFDDNTNKLKINKSSILDFFEVLKEKYDSRIVDLCRVFISIYIVLPKEIANKIYNHELLDLSGCEYEGHFYHCFRCEVVTDDYCCRDCTKWENDEFECTKCLFKYIQENKK